MQPVNGTVLVALLLTVSTMVFAVPYKGSGGQIEAYGTVMATYFIGQKVAVMCGKFPSLKAESDAAAQRYVSANKPLFDRVTQRLRQLAEINGGEIESRRLKSEIDTALPDLDKEATQEVSKIATGVAACKNILSNLRQGQWDLQVRHPHEIKAIFGADDQAGPASFIKGIVDGCIDGQKRQFAKQGLSYHGNEESVRQYCHCMAPLTADIATTADGRAKLMGGNAKIKARVKKMEAICLDGLKNGRRFAS